ncbi:YybH family protein [Aeromicrobium sp. CF4.19]|uniref:YybH family protein n=1 Tax=Aeromicrobium sp. CF4.19 TaxID=3373082 RepID=UPI003EE78DE0
MTDPTLEDGLREFVADRVRAVAARDAAPLVDAHSQDVVSFPVLPPAETHGTGDVADALTAWLDSYEVGPGYEVHHLRVAAGGDLGYCSFRYHVSGTLHGGGEVDMWVRATLVCRRDDGRWRIIHTHESVPFDPETGAGLISAGPEDD